MVSYLLWRSSHAVVTRSFYVTNYLWCSGWRDTGHTRHTWRPSVVRSWEAAPETNERQGMRSSDQSEGTWLRYQGELDTRPVKVAAELVSAGVWLWLWWRWHCHSQERDTRDTRRRSEWGQQVTRSLTCELRSETLLNFVCDTLNSFLKHTAWIKSLPPPPIRMMKNFLMFHKR